jgi:predicted AlkP superfamily pyrophosphatase or phosphodiesterase
MTSVVIMVFDGLQPSQVNPELMPNLSELARSGVTFTNHHPVFPSVTRANVASMVTGRSPGGHGLAGNRLMVRDFNPTESISALEPELTQVAEKTGRVLLAPTLAEVLSSHGHEYWAIGAGTSGNAYLQNPTAEKFGGATIHHEFTLPRSLNQELASRFGPWPDEARPNTARTAHSLRIMTEYILAERDPTVALIWSSEPDKSQHDSPVGSSLSHAAVKEADGQFGELMDWLRRTGREADTDVMVASDHGYSTISQVINVEGLVRDAGFPAGGEPGGVTVAANGGSALFYTRPGDHDTAKRLAFCLMAQPWCGSLTVSDSAGEIPGTLPASLVGNQGARCPEIAMSFHWDSAANGLGYQGTVYSTGGAAGKGQHGSMSKHEMNNVLFAWGPSFKQNIKVNTPSGNVDLAPTVLRILGINDGPPMDGRVLEEALANGPDPISVTRSTKVHQAEHRLGQRVYNQSIKVSTVGTTIYVDEGNGGLA